MNAHINHDLPLAVVSTCERRNTTPDPHHDDFKRVDAILDDIDEPLRQSFLEGAAHADELAAVHLCIQTTYL